MWKRSCVVDCGEFSLEVKDEGRRVRTRKTATRLSQQTQDDWRTQKIKDYPNGQDRLSSSSIRSSIEESASGEDCLKGKDDSWPSESKGKRHWSNPQGKTAH